MVAQADTVAAALTPVGFIMTKKVLVTIRFAELKAFTVVSDLITHDRSITSSAGVLTALLEAIIDREQYHTCHQSTAPLHREGFAISQLLTS